MKNNIPPVSTWQAFSHAKCPRCRTGQVFTGTTYSFGSHKMKDTCSHCGLRYEREPGYFYVAMFVSYGMNVAEMLTVGIACYVFGLKLTFDNLWYYFGALMLTSVVFAPFNFRYSRLILLYWLSPGLNYEPEMALKKPGAENS